MQQSLSSKSLTLVRPELEPAEVVTIRSEDFDAIYRRYASYVAAVAYRLLGRDGDEVDDVVQEVFVAVLNDLKGLQQPGALKGWLATVTVRVASRRLKRRRLRALFRLEQQDYYSDRSVAITAPQEHRALLGRIYRILDDAPVAHRVAWTLRYLEGEPLEQVALLCQCSLATAKRRIAAAQLLLDEVLSDD